MDIMYIISIIFFLLGLAMKVFKWDFLIAGYNTMSKEKKENVDKEGLCKATGNFLMIVALLLLINAVTGSYGYRFISLISMLLIFPLTIVFIVAAQKYDHNEKTKSNKLEIKIGIGFTVFFMVILFIMFMYGAQDPRVDISKEKIRISGMYSASIDVNKILDISIKDEMPNTSKKVNGFDLGYIMRGDFTLEGMGKARIYIHENKPPFVIINTEDHFYIINYKESKKTQKLYEELNSIIEK